MRMAPEAEMEYLLKICVIGETDSLKQQFGQLATTGNMTENLTTLGIDIGTKKRTIEKHITKFIIAIIATEVKEPEKATIPFEERRPQYYRGASGCLILFDKGTVETFTQVTRWLAEFRKHIPESIIPVALVGIKIEDQEERITPEEGQQLAAKLHIAYYETTLTDKAQVEFILTEMAKKAYSVM